jgi:DNA-binding CsgD family transcriptional regulator
LRGQPDAREHSSRHGGFRRRLLERERELAIIGDGLDAARAGRGRAILIEGPPGIGKSRLAEHARASGRLEGLQALAARGSVLEGAAPLGVARELFGRVLADEPRRDDEANGAGPTHADQEAVYRLTTQLAAERPLVITVDDVQWADRESLLWLSYLARRLEQLPVLVVLATTATATGDARELVDVLRSDPAVYVLRPAALSRAAVVALVLEALGPHAHADFCDACHAATGGIPFLLHALLTALRVGGVDGAAAADARAVSAIGPAAVARHVLRRLRNMKDATALLRAAAILGDRADLGHAAVLAGLDPGPAATAADVLASVDVLKAGPELTFVYPIVRAAIYSDLELAYKAGAHKRAARLLRADPASQDAVAQHLLSARRAGDGWVVDRVRDAARRATHGGSIGDAAIYLRRALAEPPERRRRAAILSELGSTEVRAGAFVGIEHLNQAIEQSEGPQERAAIALELGRLLTATANWRAAVGVLERALTDASGIDRTLRGRLEVALTRAELGDLGRAAVARRKLAELIDRPGADLEADPALLSMLAIAVIAQGGAPERGAALAARAVAASREVLNEDSTALAAALTALTWMDEFDLAWQVWSETLAQALARGSLTLAAIALCLRSHVAYRRGWVDRAQQDVQAARELARDDRWGPETLVYPTAFLLDALIERDELDAAADELAARGLTTQLPELWEYNVLLDSRGRLRLAQGRAREALDDLRECGRRLAAWGVDNPAVISWRSTAACASLALGDRDEARRLAHEESVLARKSGSRRALGIALRCEGVAQAGETGLRLLEESVRALEASKADLEYARSLIELGAMLRQSGEPAGARDCVSRGIDLALRIGATGLVGRGRDELLASGARPRRFARRGLDSLTSRQREVAQLAARGLTNREIAESLIVTENTVATHLRLAYRKLDVSSRGQLSELFESSPALAIQPDYQ